VASSESQVVIEPLSSLSVRAAYAPRGESPASSAPWTLRRAFPLLILPAALAAAIYVSGIPLWPDADYYLGGVGLYPSPVGTLLGSAVGGGYTGLGILNAAAGFAILLLVSLIALELGNRPLVAQGLVLLMVPGGWFVGWGMDAPAVALLLVAGLLELRGRHRWALAAAALAGATHLAALPLALSAILIAHGRRKSVVALVLALAAAGAALALATPYRAAFQVLHTPGALLESGHEFLRVCWPLLLLSPVAFVQRRARFLVFGFAIGGIIAGAVPAAVGQPGPTLARYVVPCLIVAAPALSLRRSLGWLPSRLRSRVPARHGA